MLSELQIELHSVLNLLCPVLSIAKGIKALDPPAVLKA